METHPVMIGLQGNSYPSMMNTIRATRKNVNENDLIYIGGSTFAVVEGMCKLIGNSLKDKNPLAHHGFF